MTEKVLVTGAAGFIGSHVCERLIAEGTAVVGLDNFDPFYDRAIKEANVAGLRAAAGFTLVEGDIRQAADVERALAEAGAGPVTMVVHLAAKAGVRPSIVDPLGYADVNIRGTQVLLEAARRREIKQFVFASSSSVYGNNEKVPFAETDNVDYPISPYAATKKAAELLCHTYSHLYGMDINCLRFFTVYGPRQRPDLAIHKFARLMEAGQPIPVYGDGSMARDFTYIDDIVEGVLGAMRHWGGYAIYNLGESQPWRLDALIEELERALGKHAVIERKPVPPGDVLRTFADIERARKALGYNPKTPLPEGLQVFVKWLRAQRTAKP